MAFFTYYDTLGVQRTATTAQIQSAYRRRAMQWHPDRNKLPGATKMLQEINEAYECLKNPARRQAYDARIRKAEAEEAAKAARAQQSRREQDPPPHDAWQGIDAQLSLRPEMLVRIFDGIDAWLRRVFASAMPRG